MDRFVLTDVQWAKMEPHCLGEARRPWTERKEQPSVCRGVLWIVRSGSPWRDLPASFGTWSTVYTRWVDGCDMGTHPGPWRLSPLSTAKWTRDSAVLLAG